LRPLVKKVGKLEVVTQILPDLSQKDNPLHSHPFGGTFVFFEQQTFQKIAQLHRQYKDHPHAFLIEIEEISLPFSEQGTHFKFKIAPFDPMRNLSKKLFGYWLADKRIVQLCEATARALGQAAASERMETCCLEALAIYEAWVNKKMFQILTYTLDADGTVLDTFFLGGFHDEDDAVAIAQEIHNDAAAKLKTA
jgi:hypothetical protein